MWSYTEWKTVSCYKPFISDVFCQFEQKTEGITRNLSLSTFLPNEKSCVVKSNVCFIFISHRIGNDAADQLVTTRVLIKLPPTTWVFLYEAVHIKFPPIFSLNMESFSVYNKYSHVYRFESYSIGGVKKHVEGFYVISKNIGSKEVHSNLLFLYFLPICL